MAARTPHPEQAASFNQWRVTDHKAAIFSAAPGATETVAYVEGLAADGVPPPSPSGAGEINDLLQKSMSTSALTALVPEVATQRFQNQANDILDRSRVSR